MMADKQKLEPLTTRIPISLGTRLRVYRAKHRVSIQHLITKALEEYLAKGKKKKKSESRE
jgi:hypothetical protein